ncbi:putative zinc transporter ZIP1-like, partial [Penaeus vannamei]
ELGHTHEWETFAEFPWGFFVVTCGFLVIFTIDKLVHAMEHAKQGSGGTNSHILLQKSSSTTFSSRCEDPEATDSSSDCQNCHELEGGHDVPSSVIFLVALGIHSVFEGIAVGLQTEKDKVLEFSVAVLVHETVMAFTFGMEVSKSQVLSRWSKAFYVLVFTSTIPVGIAGVGLRTRPRRTGRSCPPFWRPSRVEPRLQAIGIPASGLNPCLRLAEPRLQLGTTRAKVEREPRL